MSGNVWEWIGGLGGERRGSNRVIRGGSWDIDARNCRSATRISIPPAVRGTTLGFRLSRSVR